MRGPFRPKIPDALLQPVTGLRFHLELPPLRFPLRSAGAPGPLRLGEIAAGRGRLQFGATRVGVHVLSGHNRRFRRGHCVAQRDPLRQPRIWASPPIRDHTCARDTASGTCRGDSSRDSHLATADRSSSSSAAGLGVDLLEVGEHPRRQPDPSIDPGGPRSVRTPRRVRVVGGLPLTRGTIARPKHCGNLFASRRIFRPQPQSSTISAAEWFLRQT